MMFVSKREVMITEIKNYYINAKSRPYHLQFFFFSTNNNDNSYTTLQYSTVIQILTILLHIFLFCKSYFKIDNIGKTETFTGCIKMEKRAVENCGVARAVSEIKLSECTARWTVKNFSHCTKNLDNGIVSPLFAPVDHPQFGWYLRLYPRSFYEEYKNFLSLGIIFKSRPDLKVEGEYDIKVINDNNAIIYSIKNTNTFERKDPILIADFINPEAYGKMGWIPNNVITIICTIKIAIGCVNCDVQKQNIDAKLLNNRARVLDDLERMLENKTLSDTTLVCCDKSYQVHRAILAARSPVFSAMFSNNMREKESNRVTIDDMEPEAIEELLRFIYVSKINKLATVSRGLLAAADKYDMKDLKDICEDFICNELTVENAAETLGFADLYGTDKLRSRVVQFIILHKELIIDTPGFNSLKSTKPHLLVDVFESMVIGQSMKLLKN